MIGRIDEPSFPNDDHSQFAGPDFHEEKTVIKESSTHQSEEQEYSEHFLRSSSHEYLSLDKKIYADVCDILGRSHELNASLLQITVEEGIVTLEGTLPTRNEKRIAEVLIQGRPGVRNVHNHILLSQE